MTTAWLLLAAAFALIVANGLFVAAEFSLVTVERGAVERAAASGDRRAGGVAKALRKLSFELSGAQLGITVTSLVVGMLAEPALSVLLRPVFTDLGVPASAAGGVAVAVGMVLATVVQMVIGELVPKNWAISQPLRVARAVTGPHRVFSAVCRPLITFLNGSANRAVRALGLEPAEELAHARTPAELVALAQHSAKAGVIEEDTADLFVRTLGLTGLTAQSVMTPRVDVSSLQGDATATDVLNLTRATGLSRFPVYTDTLDEVTGTVTLKDALAVPADQRSTTRVSDIAVPPLLVPETLPAQRLLELLRRSQPMAVVVDEYGGTAGVVTLEDIIEEMVGEVLDEHDPADVPDLVPLAPVGSLPVWDADGRSRVDQLESIGLYAPDGPYDTLGGLVADLLGKIPAPGDSAELPGWRLTVLDTDRRRTSRVRLERTGHLPGGPHDDEEQAR
ncbi:hemolysin family protein [Peterkaempfera bronchialis]|uniref:HlyC/CorC family transporter n=1 Tax=Peterkaempfera bronchialis TaxID=2126346 RepID=A0A345T458_9ACTN|nr:hemolysin family protein [Peterkaempfera bronchialis]AXI80763.1 HlyC/CorC family transporter [Peterkaempfera bronchialis]